MNDNDRDTLMRMAAFEHVRRLGEVHDHLTANELKPGFVFEGARVPLVNPQRGIFKPQQMRFLLSIKTVFPKEEADLGEQRLEAEQNFAVHPSDYKHIALGLIFLKYISDAFEAKRAELLKEELADAEDPEEYLAERARMARAPEHVRQLRPLHHVQVVLRILFGNIADIHAEHRLASLIRIAINVFHEPMCRKRMHGNRQQLSSLGFAN